MSFRRGDDERRYGHIPPVQYPVASQGTPPATYPNRRPSFNSGDDGTAYDSHNGRPAHHPSLNTGVRSPAQSEQDMFLAGHAAAGSARPGYGGTSPLATSGYQHQYQGSAPPTPSTYNPQAFARSQSHNLPYHPHPSRWPQSQGGSTSPSFSPNSAASYTPAPYNPAAFSGGSGGSGGPQRHSTYSGNNNYSNHSSYPAYGSPSSVSSPHFQAPPQTNYPPASYSGYDQSPAPSPGFPPQSQSAYDHSYSQYQGAHPEPASPPPGSSQAPYPTYSQIPVGPNYSANDPHSFLNRPSRSGSSASPMPSPPVHSTASPGLHRHPTNAPLPSRPIDNIVEEQYATSSHLDTDAAGLSQENIMHDIENELNRGGSIRRMGLDQRNGNVPDDELQNLRRLTSTASYHSNATTVHSQDEPAGVGRYSSTASTVNRNHSNNPYTSPDEGEGNESDPEGAAGAWAMHQAEEDDRRLSGVGAGAFGFYSAPDVPALPNLKEEASSDSDYAGVDLGLAGGGFSGAINYGYDVGSPPSSDTMPPEGQLATPRSNHVSQRSNDSARYPAFEQANVDYGGTGGLQQPTHRLSFDAGEERVNVHAARSDSDSPYKEEYPDMFYHPGLSNRPLPAIPGGSDDSSSLLSAQSPNQGLYQQTYSQSIDPRPYSGPDAQYGQNAHQLQVERSISLSDHITSPHVQPPGRSKTDATEERNARIRHARQASSNVSYDYASNAPSSANYDVITLPSGRRKKFQADKLTIMDVQACTEPWALSGIARWVQEMAEGEPDLRRKTVEDALVRLFNIKVPTMNVADAETLGVQVTDSMLEAGILVPEEEWLKFGQGSISGVLWQLTGAGCYTPKLHEHDDDVNSHEVLTRCYSHHCTRTLKKANLDDLLSPESGKERHKDWAAFYGLKPDNLANKSKKEIERQNILHEIITTEEGYVEQLDVLRTLYREALVQADPPIISQPRLEKFVNAVFVKADAVEYANRNHLLAQLKYRQKEQGPWIAGFSDILREFVRKARTAYVDYASAFPYAQFLMKREEERNVMFKQFLSGARANARSQRLDWTTFLKAPITRLARYPLLLETSLKKMVQDSEEKTNLAKAIEEIRAITHEADSKVAEMQAKVKMIEIDQKLVLRPGCHADLNLDHLGREVIHEHELQRVSSKGMRWVDTYAILFDHYLILSKIVGAKDGRQENKYDVSKEPIPMPLLFLESSNDDPVSKQKGIATPLTRTTNTAPDTRLNKVGSNNPVERPQLEHTLTSSSGDAEGRVLYPFRVKHLGHEVYTLYATSQSDRREWCEKIIEAKTRHAKALHAQNAEPFRLRVMADSAFAYDSISAIGKYVGGVHISGTPLDRSIRECEKTFGPGRGPPPISRANVHCSTGFTAFGRNMIAVGTEVGVCVSEASDQRGWLKTVSTAKVTQISVLEEFSIVLILTDRNLVSYPLDVVAPPSNYPAPTSDNPRRSPQRLQKDVAFFATARMKDRMLVFYKKREGLHSMFKVVEPVFQKSTEKRSRLFGRKAGGNTESFRDYDEFYLPTECFSLNIFNSYIAISTQKGFELLTLDKKVPMSIPDVKQPAIANIANRIREQRPLGMFRLNDQEFLLAYEDCAVYVDKYGDVSRSVIMEYSGKQKRAKGATMYGQYLLLFNEDYVEVRNAENGRLRQIIAGRDVRVLDYGVKGPTGGLYQANGRSHVDQGPGGEIESKGTVKICMAHPEVAGQQIVLEMLLNNGHAE